MESFNLDNVSKRMPYAPLKEGYFEEFAAITTARIEREAEAERAQRSVNSRWRILLSSSIAVAAMVAVALTTLLLDDNTYSRAINSFDRDLDKYVESLSDDELSTLYYEVESSDVFYSNL